MQTFDPNSPEILKRSPEAFRLRMAQLARAEQNVEQRVRVAEEVKVVSETAPATQKSASLDAFHSFQESMDQMSAVEAARLLADQARNN